MGKRGEEEWEEGERKSGKKERGRVGRGRGVGGEQSFLGFSRGGFSHQVLVSSPILIRSAEMPSKLLLLVR